MSDKRFTTDEIVATVMKWRGWDMDAVDEPAYREIIARLRAADKTEKLYHELLYEVARKFPGETRHETARRYIRETESRTNGAAKAIAGYEGKEKR